MNEQQLLKILQQQFGYNPAAQQFGNTNQFGNNQFGISANSMFNKPQISSPNSITKDYLGGDKPNTTALGGVTNLFGKASEGLLGDKVAGLTGKIGGKVGGKLAGSMGLVGGISDALGSFIPSSADNEVSEGINSGMDVASDALMAIPTPFTQIAGGAMKVAGFGKDALDKLTNGKTGLANEFTMTDKILDSHLLGLTPIGVLNSLTKEKIEGSDKDLESESTLGYDMSTGPDTSEVGGVSKAFGKISKFFSGKDSVNEGIEARKKLAERTDGENLLKKSASYSEKKNLQAAGNSTQDLVSKNRQRLQGSGNLNKLLVAKKGDKLLLKNIVNNVVQNRAQRLIENEEIETLAKGGKVNVIPEGVLHSRKHNLDIDGITEKGIPVVTHEKGDKIKQHAEVEVDEVILHLSLTKKLEKLLEQFNKSEIKKEKDELQIEAGKLLTKELLENTEDNTGLIDKTK